MSVAERQRAYAADVTYLTAKEAGFDHLRDGLALEPGDRAQRAYHFALVDEADSILIDEARIPLVIAGETGEALAGPERLAALVRDLVPGRDFDTDEHAHNIALTEAGTARVEAALGVRQPARARERLAPRAAAPRAPRRAPAAARRRLHRAGRQGRARGRVDRPRRRQAPLARRAARRGRGQGRPAAQLRGPHPGAGHAAALPRALPAPRRDDRHRAHRGRGARGSSTACAR